VHLVHDQVKHTQDTRVKQVLLVRIFEENLHDGIEDVVLDDAQNALPVLGSNDSLEKLDDLDVDLSGVELAQFRNFVKNLVLDKEDPHVCRRQRRVQDELGKELKDQTPTLLEHLTHLYFKVFLRLRLLDREFDRRCSAEFEARNALEGGKVRFILEERKPTVLREVLRLRIRQEQNKSLGNFIQDSVVEHLLEFLGFLADEVLKKLAYADF